MNNIEQLKQEVKQILNKKPILMDSFDSSYLNDFHHILKENFGITNVKDSKLKNILNLLGTPNIKTTLELRDSLLKTLDEKEFFPKRMSQELRNQLKHNRVPNFDNLSNVTSQESKEKAKEFLIGYSQLQGGGTDISLGDFERNWGGRTLEMRHKLNSILTEEKENNPDVKMLTLGPRWPAEITYIREKFGIDAMGLDLFSIDESKIVIGDMHEMPFEDNSYDIVYEKNTYNKSYDFRKALDESVRILKPGGLLIYDECMDYVEGCSENARTNLKSHKWTEIYLENNIQEIVYSKEIPAFEKDKHWLGKVGLFAVRIKK